LAQVSGKADLADEIAARRIAADPILLEIGPSHAAPHVAVDVRSHTVGELGRKILSKDFVVGDLASADVRIPACLNARRE
jgi:hypothetical protein